MPGRAEIAGTRPGQHAVDRRANLRAKRLDARDMVVAGECLQRYAEAEHHDRAACRKDDRRGMGIDMDVEFGRRRDVAEADGAAHQHDTMDLRQDVRGQAEREREVGQRPQRAQGHAVCRRRPAELDDRRDGMARCGRAGRRRQAGTGKPVRSADEGGRLQREDQWRVCSAIDRHLRAGQVADPQGIGGGLIHGDIARNGGDRPQVQGIGACKGQQQGDGVILAGIGIDDDRGALRVSLHGYCPP